MSVDYLACPNCGCPFSDGEFCNLTCRRAGLAQQCREWLTNNPNGKVLRNDLDLGHLMMGYPQSLFSETR